jgi:hypothetical protein
MKTAITIAAMTALLATTDANAGQWHEAHWASVGNWNVFSSDAGYCGMSVSYQNGHTLLLGEGKGGWILTISGRNVYVHGGEVYKVYMRASNGSNGTLVGQGYADNTISFPGLTLSTVFELARNRGFSVDRVGSFSLAGSARAIVATHQCWQSIQGTPPPAAPSMQSQPAPGI